MVPPVLFSLLFLVQSKVVFVNPTCTGDIWPRLEFSQNSVAWNTEGAGFIQPVLRMFDELSKLHLAGVDKLFARYTSSRSLTSIRFVSDRPGWFANFSAATVETFPDTNANDPLLGLMTDLVKLNYASVNKILLKYHVEVYAGDGLRLFPR